MSSKDLKLAQSFKKIKADIFSLNSSITFSIAKQSELESNISLLLSNSSIQSNSISRINDDLTKLRNQINSLSKEFISKSELDSYLSDIITKIVKNTMLELSNSNRGIKPNILSKSISSDSTKTSKIAKSHIKKTILDLTSQKILLSELKSIIVDKRKYCSKATFYRYVSDLKKKSMLESVELDGDVYLYNSKFELI